MLSSAEIIPYYIYHYLSLISIVSVILTTAIVLKRKSRHIEHTTAIILMASFLIVSFLKSIIASALTIALINFNISVSDSSTIKINLVIMALSIYLKFIILLIIIDIGLKAKFYKHYGTNIISILMCIAALIVMLGLSIFMAWPTLLFRGTGINFVVYFKICITTIQILNTLTSIFLYFFINYLRKESFTSSSLSLRHECGKNIILLRNYLPMVTIDSIIGIIAIIFSLSGTYLFGFSIVIGFPCFYLFFELSSILIFFSLIHTLRKSRRIAILTSIFSSDEVSVSLSVVSVRTMTNEVPTSMTHDDYFKRLQRVWQ